MIARAAAVLACLMLPLSLAGQRATDLLRDARQAYLVLELDRASQLARQALDRDAPDALEAAQRADALMLLGTIAVLQERPREARERFRALVLLDPRYEPDSLTTPSVPLQAFRQARESVKASVIDLVPAQRVSATRPVRATVLVSSLQDIDVVVLDGDGDTVEVLWSGPVRDAVSVTWLPAPGARGRHVLVGTTREDGRPARDVQVPLVLRPIPTDTLVWPAPPALVAVETAAPRGAWRPLALGLGLGAAVMAAPIAAGVDAGTPGRLAVAGGLTVGGVVAYLRGRRAGVDEAAVAENLRRRVAWERERDRVTAENARRRAQYELDVTAGPPTRHERGGPP